MILDEIIDTSTFYDMCQFFIKNRPEDSVLILTSLFQPSVGPPGSYNKLSEKSEFNLLKDTR